MPVLVHYLTQVFEPWKTGVIWSEVVSNHDLLQLPEMCYLVVNCVICVLGSSFEVNESHEYGFGHKIRCMQQFKHYMNLSLKCTVP